MSSKSTTRGGLKKKKKVFLKSASHIFDHIIASHQDRLWLSVCLRKKNWSVYLVDVSIKMLLPFYLTLASRHNKLRHAKTENHLNEGAN